MGAADVRLEVVRAPGGVVVLADGRPLPVPPGGDPRTVALAAAQRHAARHGRVLRVDLVDDGVTRLAVGPSGPVPTPGPVDPVPTPGPTGPVVPRPVGGSTGRTGSRGDDRPETPSGRSRRRRSAPPAEVPPERRPVGSLVAAALVAVAVLIGAVGTGVATLASSQALPDSCRPVTLYAVGGAGGGSDVLTAVTDPLARQFGEKVSTVTVPPPATGGSYASAESAAVGALSDAVGDHVEGCPTGSIMIFGYSAGAQVAGDLAARIGTGLEPRIPADLIRAVGLFGDPARSPATRAVPDGTTGQGVLPPRAVGFGTLDARTIQICAPGDPVCDSPATAGNASLEQALTSPTHATYSELPIAQGTSAPQWAVASLGKVIAAVPTDAGPAVTTTTAPAAVPTTGAGGASGAVTTTPGPGYEEEPGDAAPGSGDVTATRAPGSPGASGDTGAGSTTTRAPGGVTGTRSSGSADTGGGVTGTRAPGSADSGATGTRAPGGSGSGSGSGDVTATRAPAATSTRDPGGVTATRAPGSGGGTGATTSAPDTGSSGSDVGGDTRDTTTTTARRSGSAGPEAGDDPSSGRGTGDGAQGRATKAAFSLTDGLAGFKSTPWNNQNATDPSDAESPNVPGREAVKFEMPGGGKRTEAEPDIPEFQDGETKFVGYAGFFDQGFPTDTGTWQLIMQFKQPGTGSPPLAVEVGNGQLRLANNGGNQKDFCPVGPGAFSFQLGITFGGGIDAYCNGQQTLSGYRTPESNVKGSAYLKTGIYRDESIGQDSTLFLNDLKIGDDLASVSGLAGAGGDAGSGSGSGAGGTSSSGAATAGRSGTGNAAGGSGGAAATATSTSRRTAGAAPASGSDTSGRPAGTAAVRGQQVCDKFGSTEIAGGAFMVQNNEWGAADGQCITATTQGFTVDSGEHSKDDSPASYPSIMSGCWMGTCTEGTTLPQRISDIGPISSSIAGEIPAGTTSNLAYDIWADSTPKKNGHNDAVELMIWLKETGGIRPIGQQAGTATIGGATWDVWKGENGGVNVISYVRQGYVDSADDLPLTDFVDDAVTQGSVKATDFLTNIQAGFEPWTGGPGMALTRFDVRYGGGG